MGNITSQEKEGVNISRILPLPCTEGTEGTEGNFTAIIIVKFKIGGHLEAASSYFKTGRIAN